ncbi:LysM peptidoglycan-binding domain-containing protein [Mobilitalea sibirica]|uniref:LysM peptidoglycan-binding domain-containing protein n=1 Tax=Mobilitalea sibirica TaxID=1462919 RepID=A0A8J7H3T3_9FIRM|nr:LysM peptidoglycan-binding domain-containing protein [Mobilitalea sibirica]MBH1941867.1 LysM peptidoglycan-binding domain-containing protein [Mobilitalea sibirica]
MEIYVVQQGDTINSIASQFGITAERLIIDNDIEEPYQLVVGQALIITYPSQVYTVEEGDTLEGIADAFNTTVMQLLRNNPFLANRQYIYPGETLVISYNNDKGSLWVVGYTYPFIRDEILRMTLPYLTFLLIFNHRIAAGGEITGGDNDIDVIETAKLYGVPSTLVLTAFSQTGVFDLEAVAEILNDKQIQDKVIDTILTILETKGYNGVNISMQLINENNQQLYLDLLTNITDSLHPQGYSVYVTINPGLTYHQDEITFEKINYTAFSEQSDGLLFLTYDLGSIDRPPNPISIVTSGPLLDYIVSQVPLDKIRIMLPTLGYDWQLPYVEGRTRANALNYDSALALARQNNAVIQYDETTLSAYFEYVDNFNRPHIVYFKDARSIDASIKILQDYGIDGIGIWNVMYYFSQLWLLINSQYQIKKVLD